jgi:hypothetical protein
VGSGEGEKMAAMWGCNYHETSAVSYSTSIFDQVKVEGGANGQRLDNQILGVFEDIVRQLRQTTFGRREERQKKKSRKCIVL